MTATLRVLVPALAVASLRVVAFALIGAVSVTIPVAVAIPLTVLSSSVAGLIAVFLRHCNKSLLVVFGAPVGAAWPHERWLSPGWTDP